MNRIEFMTELASLLQDIPAEERREAMAYYNDYFDEAGVENEAQVIAELGNPEKVSAIIKEGIDGFDESAGEFTDTGYHDPKYEEQDVPEPRYVNNKANNHEENKKERWTSKPLKFILIVAIIICAVPVIGPLLLGIVAAAIGILLALSMTVIAIVVASIAVVIAGIAVLVTGIVSMFGEIAAGLALSGIGLILIPLGMIATVASVKLCTVVFPAIIRGIVWVCRRPFQRKAVA